MAHKIIVIWSVLASFINNFAKAESDVSYALTHNISKVEILRTFINCKFEDRSRIHGEKKWFWRENFDRHYEMKCPNVLAIDKHKTILVIVWNLFILQ